MWATSRCRYDSPPWASGGRTTVFPISDKADHKPKVFDGGKGQLTLVESFSWSMITNKEAGTWKNQQWLTAEKRRSNGCYR